MVAFAVQFQPVSEAHSLTVGVFEDDALLLRLAASFPFAESGRPRAPVLMTAEDLALEIARLADTVTWDL